MLLCPQLAPLRGVKILTFSRGNILPVPQLLLGEQLMFGRGWEGVCGNRLWRAQRVARALLGA